MGSTRLSATLFKLIIIIVFASCKSQTKNNSIPYSTIYHNKDSSMIYNKLHKCVCDGNEALFNNECVKSNITIPGLVDYSTTRVINMEEIEEIVVEDLLCPKNLLNITLSGESFALQTSGKLFNTNYGLNLDFTNYCVEYILNDYGELNMEVHLCLPIPTIPKCCPNSRYESLANCSHDNITDVEVSFSLGKRTFQMETKSFLNELNCQEDENRTTVPISSVSESTQLKLTNEGLILQHKASLFGDLVYVPSPEYCIEVNANEDVASRASYCYKNPFAVHQQTCSGNICVRKCCSKNEVFDMINMKCSSVDESKRWTPEFHDPTSLELVKQLPDFKQVFGLPLNCEFFALSSNNDPPDTFKLLANGFLYVENWNMTLESYQYCVDNFKYGSEILQEALVCFLEKHEANSVGCESIGGAIYPALLLISCIFLGVTLVVYAIIPEFHMKVQGKCLIASVSSLLSAYLALVTVQLASTQLSYAGCIVFGLLTQFSFLASFFWLNVMSFDIWRTLRSVQTGKDSPSSVRRRYLKYSLYAWGCPIIIVLVTVIMQFLPESVDKKHLIVPQLAEERCFFPIRDTRAMWIYFYAYISIILTVNSFFFLHLALLLFKARKISESALGKKTRLHKEWAKLYLKLFLIMGITWVFEVTSWVHGMCGFWLVTDILNTLRGVLIFVIFVCKRDVIKKLLSESSPAFHRMRNTVLLSSNVFSRSSKRTSSFYVDPTSFGTHEETAGRNHADANL